MFTWKKDFELGIPSIDQQHRHLFELGNQINELLSDFDEAIDSFDPILKIIDELKAYTQYHFTTEESLFEKYHYPDLGAHKKEHDDFVAYLESIDLHHMDRQQKAFLMSLLKRIASWIFNHIITTDFMYREYLAKLIK